MADKTKTIHQITLISISIAIITLCAWISIPFIVPVTLQLLAVFLIAGCFPLKISLSAVIFYLLLGSIGAPVFSGFNGGFSAFLGASGGFLIGFIPSVIIISLFRSFYTKKALVYVAAMLVSLILCYTLGCLWYIYVFAYQAQASLLSALTICVFPFIFFDIVKIFLAALVQKKLLPYIQRLSI